MSCLEARDCLQHLNERGFTPVLLNPDPRQPAEMALQSDLGQEQKAQRCNQSLRDSHVTTSIFTDANSGRCQSPIFSWLRCVQCATLSFLPRLIMPVFCALLPIPGPFFCILRCCPVQLALWLCSPSTASTAGELLSGACSIGLPGAGEAMAVSNFVSVILAEVVRQRSFQLNT